MTSERASMAPTVEFDHHSPEYARNWRGILADVRSLCPVVHSSAYGGFTLLTRYADVEQAIKDNLTFSSRHSVEPGSIFGGVVIPSSSRVSVPIEMDPPEYTPYRKVLNPWFSPARSAAYEPLPPKARRPRRKVVGPESEAGRVASNLLLIGGNA